MGGRTYTQLWFASGESAGGDAVSGRGVFTRRHVSIQYSPPGDSEEPALTISHLPLETTGLDVPVLKVEAGEFSQGAAVKIEKLGTRTFTGTWTFTNGSATVNAGGADGNALAEIAVGDSIRQSDGTQWYQVTAVPDDDNVTISPVFQQATHTDEADASLYKSDATGAFLTGESDGVDLFSMENDGDIWNLGTMYAHQANVGGIAAVDDGTAALDMTLGNLFTNTPGENTSWSTSSPTNGIGGQLASFLVDNSGGYTVAWGTGYTSVDSIAAPDTGVHGRLMQFDGTTWHQLVATEDGQITNVGVADVFREIATRNVFGPSTAGRDALTGDYNFAAGDDAGSSLTTGSNGVYIGRDAGEDITDGSNLVAIGIGAMQSSTTVDDSVAIGNYAMGNFGGGNDNNAIGESALAGAGATSTGSFNNAYGTTALTEITTGIQNNAFGQGAGANITTGSYGIFIGHDAGVNVNTTSTNTICIGKDSGPASLGVIDDALFIDNHTTDTPLIEGDFANHTIDINGELDATTKTFKIRHPLNSTKYLMHGVVEAPEFGLVYRGQVKLLKGSAVVNIDDQSHMARGVFNAIAQNPTIYLQNITGYNAVKPSSISNGDFYISAENPRCEDLIAWHVLAERRDSFIMDSPRTDADGLLILEPDIPERKLRYIDENDEDRIERHAKEMEVRQEVRKHTRKKHKERLRNGQSEAA